VIVDPVVTVLADWEDQGFAGLVRIRTGGIDPVGFVLAA
jgi:hypothetical protein